MGYVPAVLAQNTRTLSGYVIDAATNQPMPFANVYLNNTTQGTISDEKGHFVLTNLPLGTLEVVASFVGYQTNRQTMRTSSPQNLTLTLRLKPADQTLAGVSVKAKRNEQLWQEQLRQFKTQLFGEPFGGQCRLTNPDALHFTEENGHLKATASQPLVIENQALGYRIWYDLAYFDAQASQVYYGGAARFEALKPTNERQANRFGRNQMRAYLGSARHLMASLLAGDYEQQGFRVFEEDTTVAMPLPGDTVTLQRAIGHRLLPLRRAALIQPGPLPFEYRLGSSRPLVVFYTKAKSRYSPYTDARYAYTQLTFPHGPIQVLTDGWITVPNGVEMKGSLADDRLSTLLPADWQPTHSHDSTAASASVVVPAIPEPTTRYTGEKVYVHTDRTQYVAGDTLWFKVYLLDASQHTPSRVSQTLYVHLLDSSGQLTASRILHIDSTGQSPGDLTLADSLAAGTYQLLAYTNWMRNTDNDFLFRQRIHIEASTHPVTQSNSLSSTGLSCQLFPEGGHLITGLSSRVAFQARDQQGHSLPIQGVLLNQQGDTLSDFRSIHQGMGTFSLTPLANQRYRVIVTTPDGRTAGVELPVALPTGYQLAVDNLTDPQQVRVLIHSNKPQTGQLVLLAHLRGQICYQRQLDAGQAELLVSIPYDSIRQDGILHLTLFDSHTQPIAERLAFINRQHQLRIRIQANQASYQPGQPVSLSIAVTDPAGNPISTQLSVAVTDRERALEFAPYQATLRSYLLLSSDLKGTIDEPDYYFDTTQVHARQYLDYVMMTHGWRRFSWRAILSDSTTKPVYAPETSLSIVGQVRYRDDKKVARQALLTGLLKTNRQLLPLTITTDKDGWLAMTNLLFSDTATLVLRHRTNRPIQVTLSTGPSPAFVALPSLAVGQAGERQALVNQTLEMRALMKQLRANGGRLLAAVTVKAKRLDASRTDARRQGYGVADQTLTVTEQMASGKQSASQLIGRSRFVKPVYMIDGMQVSSDALEMLSASDVAAIDLVYAGAPDGDGVINILTKQGPEGGKPIHQVIKTVIGYAVSREFYSFNVPKSSSSKPRDYRSTLYWNPALQTDRNGQARISFSNTDRVTTIQVLAEGISGDGQPGYGQVRYKVQLK